MPARAAFARGQLLVVPSRAESLPYIVLEAAAATVPMIVTNVGGIPEIFGADAATLMPPGDAAALARAIRAGLSEPADRAAPLTPGGCACAVSSERFRRRRHDRGACWPPTARRSRYGRHAQGRRHHDMVKKR